MLTKESYDILVIGGGIFGICIARDAALRGLSVGLVEKGDFAEGASSNCFKMVHGGLRYMQHADLPRVRESSRERSNFLRIAPHLVDPLTRSRNRIQLPDQATTEQYRQRSLLDRGGRHDRA